MIKVCLVDDHIVTRKGIKTVLELTGEITVILEASNGQELMHFLKTADSLPEIIILDINMPLMNGMTAIGNIKKEFPEIHILVFTLINEDDAVINMISRGACGYLAKSADPSILITAVNSIATSGFYIGQLTKREYFGKQSETKRKEGFYGREFLSAKEVEYIRLAASNRNYAEIALEMGIRPKTLENYRDSVFLKLNINNRAALAIYAFKNGLI